MMRRSLLSTPPPSVAVGVTSRHLALASLADRPGGLQVAAHAVEPLDAGAVTPALTGTNIADRGALAARLSRLLVSAGRGARRVALVLPDAVAKVSLVRLEKVPPRNRDLEELIRFHVRKAAPFHIDGAQVSFVPGVALPGGGREFVVAVAQRDVIDQYEQVCQRAGVHAGLVDLATFSLANLVEADTGPPSGDWLLVQMGGDCSSLAILRGPDLIFFRSRAGESDDELVDLVHQTAMYYVDRLDGRGFDRAFVAGPSTAGGGIESVRRRLEERLGVPLSLVDSTRLAPLADRIDPGAGLTDTLAPLVGILVRERRGSRPRGR